jgi:mannose-6-phosphate isomerase
MIVRGAGKVTVDGREIAVAPGIAVDIPSGAAHRIQSLGGEKLVFIEIQRGDYLGEDDIVRLEDDFGRVPR